ncbi:Multiple organellar RNA editing factor 6 [Hirschfeldia incana]|nr:Multiple organellar RNA editing factor 6 [Hirschfeldia incana]
MAKLLSRSTASRVATRFFSTSRAAASSRSNLISRQSSPTLFHFMGFVPADSTRLTTIRTLTDRSGGSYSPLNSRSNFSDRAPTEMAPLFPGCDYEHWLIVMDKPGGENASRQQMIDCYVQTLAKIVGSEEEAKRKIYNVSCERYFGFGCEIDEETSNKLEGIPGVLFVLPDSYVDPEYKDYGAELFVNGEVVPRPPERQRKIVELTTQRSPDKPRYDRTRNVRRRDNMR